MTNALPKQWISGTPSLMRHAEELYAGYGAYCPGCHNPITLRAICEALEELGVDPGNAIMVFGVTCFILGAEQIYIDFVHAAHGRATDVATAVKRVNVHRPLVFTLQGDGDCIAIGTEGVIHAAARAERITVIMSNNACYGATGGQMAPTTLMGQITPTTSRGRDVSAGYPIDAARLLASIRGVAYSARGAVNSAANYQRTKRYLKAAFQKQIDNIGFSFVEVVSACPPNWHMEPVDCLKWIEDEMISQFPLGEFKNVESID